MNTSMMLTPSSKCCCCLSLRTGTIVIGVGNCVLYGCLYIWYLTSDLLHQGGFGDGLGFNSADASILSILTVQLLVNILLLNGARLSVPSHTLPWLGVNAVAIGLYMAIIGRSLFLGTKNLYISYPAYVGSLTMMGLVTGLSLFCFFVVFQFRQNLIWERNVQDYHSEESGQHVPLENSLPPPSYQELEEGKEFHEYKAALEDNPPDYDAAVAAIEKVAGDCPDSNKVETK